MNYLFAFFILFLSGCSTLSSGRIIEPDKILNSAEWTKEESAQTISNRTLQSTEQASYHLIRLKGAEKPHIHATHDLTVVVIKGEANIHFKTKTVKTKVGDVIRIPRGALHWAENTAKTASEVYAVFTPSYDGKDHVVVE